MGNLDGLVLRNQIETTTLGHGSSRRGDGSSGRPGFRWRLNLAGKHCARFVFLFFVFFLSVLPGCGDTTGAPKKSIGAPVSSKSTLYLANGNGGKLLAFDLSFLDNLLSGWSPNVSPGRQFPDTVSGPSGIFLDRTKDTLYVANAAQNAIQIYDKASTLSAPLTASRVISGDLTLLDEPFGITVDTLSGRIFVANKGGNTVVAFHTDCAGTLSGNIAPCNLLRGDLTQLDVPRALALDSSREGGLLYISNMGSDSILVYKNANTIGASPSQCVLSFGPCNLEPFHIIAAHTGSENASRLELPFGLYIDSTNDRLYVVNTGQNTPAVLIYENASTLNGGVVPDRVVTGLNTQLTVPTGIDVDVSTGRVFVVNNNSPNNVNAAGGANTDSPSVLVFNDINTTCTEALCNISPSRRIGGDVSAESSTTLSNPLGIAFDPVRDITYIANTGGNTILSYSLEGNLAPLQVNAGANTSLFVPSSFFYDTALDRLYVANASTGSSPAPFSVYDQVSKQAFGSAAVPSNLVPSWKLAAASNFEKPRGIYIDKTRKLMIFLDGKTSPGFGLFIYGLTSGFQDATSPPFPPTFAPIAFPLDTKIGPTGKTLAPPTFQRSSTLGLSAGGPTGLAVDETRGLIYVSEKNNNSVVVFDYGTTSALTRLRVITGLNKPSGVFIDTQRDMLYVTNNGKETGAAVNHTADTVFIFEQASTKGDGVTGCPTGTKTPCRPNKIISTAKAKEQAEAPGSSNKPPYLKAPISPYVDLVSDRLFLINSGKDQHAVFSFDTASQQGDSAPACIDPTTLPTPSCLDTLPGKVLSGTKTLLNFSDPLNIATEGLFTGAVLLARHLNNETLYVGQSIQPLCTASCASAGLLVFGLQGKVPPGKIWSAGGNGFSSPTDMAIDPVKNVLYVANQGTNTLSRFPNADKIHVTLNVTLNVTGKWELEPIQLNRPAGLFLDTAQDRLYVSNSESANCSVGPCDTILVFNDASAMTRFATANQTLSHTQLSGPHGLTVDTTKNWLYAASKGNNAVVIFSVAGGTPVFSAAVTGSQSGLDEPIDVAVDSTRDILYVLNGGATEVLVFENASTLTGSEAPVRVISGSDGAGNNFMVSPSAMFLDAQKDVLYLADRGANAVYVFPDAHSAEGQAAHKTLSGDKTGLLNPSALTVNTAP